MGSAYKGCLRLWLHPCSGLPETGPCRIAIGSSFRGEASINSLTLHTESSSGVSSLRIHSSPQTRTSTTAPTWGLPANRLSFRERLWDQHYPLLSVSVSRTTTASASLTDSDTTGKLRPGLHRVVVPAWRRLSAMRFRMTG